MTEKEFLTKLGLSNLIGTFKTQNTYEIELKDSSEYGKVYSKLDKADFIEEEVEKQSMDLDEVWNSFSSDYFYVILYANLEKDIYTLTLVKH